LTNHLLSYNQHPTLPRVTNYLTSSLEQLATTHPI